MAAMLRLIVVLVQILFVSRLVWSDENEKLVAELQLDDLELADACENIALARKVAFLSKNFQPKIEAEESYGFMLRTHVEGLKEFSDVSTDLERNFTYQVKPGDGLLPEDKWKKLVSFINGVEALSSQTKLSCLNQSEDCYISNDDYRNILRTSRNATELSLVWSSRQSIYNDSEQNYTAHLRLVKEAATLNEFDNVVEYWENLNDFQGGYASADAFWEELMPFYGNLQNFVKQRLFRYYRLTEDRDQIPVYLLGVGDDWSAIADVVLPHRQLHYDFELDLSYKTVSDIYKNAEIITDDLSLGPLGTQFWLNSHFNGTSCGPELFDYCNEGYTELVECDSPSWTTFLDAMETSAKIALNNIDYTSLQRQKLRFSAIDDSLGTLASLLAVENIQHTDTVSEEEVRMTKLLLVAMRVMPRLAYYYMVDKWRLRYLDEYSTDDIVDSWWKHRKEYQNVTGITNKELDFLEDPRILNNQPYITKFFGVLIAFQLFLYHKNNANELDDLIKTIGSDDSFKSMVYERHTSDWPYLLTLHYGLDVTPSDLLAYFSPLEKYFNTAPLEQVPIVTTTTTTITTTMATTTMTTSPPKTDQAVLKGSMMENLVVNDEPEIKSQETGQISGEDNHVAMYVGVGVLIVVGLLIGAALLYKNTRRKRRSNNRRFDT